MENGRKSILDQEEASELIPNQLSDFCCIDKFGQIPGEPVIYLCLFPGI